MTKRIYIGEIKENIRGTPIEKFEKAVELSKTDDFRVYTNDPQFVEALEVLCSAKKSHIYIILNGKCKEITFYEAYNYLGDLYDTIDYIRICVGVGGRDSRDDIDDIIDRDIKKYYDKWGDIGE